MQYKWEPYSKCKDWDMSWEGKWGRGEGFLTVLEQMNQQSRKVASVGVRQALIRLKTLDDSLLLTG